MLVHVLLAVDSALQSRLERLLKGDGVLVRHTRRASGPAPAGRIWTELTRADADMLVVSRSVLPEPAKPWIETVRELPEAPDVVVLAEEEDPEDRAYLLTAGCMAVLFARLPDDGLRDALRALVMRRRQQTLQRRHDGPVRDSGLSDFVTESPAMLAFMSVARRVVNSRSALLILGETGVGKERLARSIHSDGPRASGPWVVVNCGALPETLLESELFGHEQGAFTGAVRSRRGYFELAHGGTIFLDEIGELPLHLQVKLLRVLEDRAIQRVGSERMIAVDVRVMAATNRNLEEEVAAKRFRPDLYYRLAVVTLMLPPMRQRPEDISALVESYVRHFSTQLGRAVTAVEPDAMAALERYTWPGNVRELINVVERAVLLGAGPTITIADLPDVVVRRETPHVSANVLNDAVRYDGLFDLALTEARRNVVCAFERLYLLHHLQATGGRIGEAAERAGINERSLYDLMRKHGLDKAAFKSAAPPPPVRAHGAKGAWSALPPR